MRGAVLTVYIEVLEFMQAYRLLCFEEEKRCGEERDEELGAGGVKKGRARWALVNFFKRKGRLTPKKWRVVVAIFRLSLKPCNRVRQTVAFSRIRGLMATILYSSQGPVYIAVTSISRRNRS